MHYVIYTSHVSSNLLLTFPFQHDTTTSFMKQIVGAILPGMDAGDGAAAGAAVGAASGGVRGLRGRRAARRMR